ncbi:glycosyltransferase [Cryptosporangium aurantiacum]|uniref:Glycosyl transferase family 2 n=1 Tax=Cryptosporangium aurantiacum TaxID=134849 RepID=A0A1M7IL36_9ACTN|nr:glycosyltransferase family 2 protein [Cryptosporangium aurantiacum]SHM41504.1 Glycosyl transferase family 2 [Cryptosporangium aurantiacum]
MNREAAAQHAGAIRSSWTTRSGWARRLADPVLWGTVGAVALTAHAAVNARRLRRPPADPPETPVRVSVLLPLRDEEHRVEPCLRALLAQRGVPGLEIVVLDDGSTDRTAAVVRRIAAGDARVRLLTGVPLPRGWLGKPHACQQLADAADPASEVLVFVDADVVLTPDAVAAALAVLDESGLDLISPYPRQVAAGAAERLVQPLLQWSWLTTLPLGIAERSPRPSLTAANGQFLLVTRKAYDAAGGHAAVRADVLEDIGLLRAVKRAGGRGVVTDGSTIAACRMYESWPELRDGYGKSLWAAFGSPTGAAATVGFLGLLYVLPVTTALRGNRLGLLGYAAGVAGRVVAARASGGRAWPDALAHPASIVTFGYLVARSLVHHRRGTLTWKGRRLG